MSWKKIRVLFTVWSKKRRDEAKGGSIRCAQLRHLFADPSCTKTFQLQLDSSRCPYNQIPGETAHHSLPIFAELSLLPYNMGNTASRDREGRLITPSIPSTAPSFSIPTDASACPVDHEAREAWLNEARKSGRQIPPHPMPLPSKPSPILTDESCDSTNIDQQPAPKAPSILQALQKKTQKNSPLATDREVSTIPRALPPETAPAKEERPANNEGESGFDKSGKWIYPSEQMFFEAMRRKNHDPKVEDMRTIVPIHNAVNERAWGEILAWERGKGGESYVAHSLPKEGR